MDRLLAIVMYIYNYDVTNAGFREIGKAISDSPLQFHQLDISDPPFSPISYIVKPLCMTKLSYYRYIM